MDKTILNLLFNYKGTITYREFRIGIIILFLMVGYYLSSLLNGVFGNVLVARNGVDWIASLYNQVVISYVPNFVPVWFIVSFSSVILAMKRMRALGKSRVIAFFSGIPIIYFSPRLWH